MAYVYILTNRPRGTLYIGVAKDIEDRLDLHSRMREYSFVKKYKLHVLVHLEEYDNIIEAIRREKQLKNWHREWKINLIESSNPQWENLLKDAETNSARRERKFRC